MYGEYSLDEITDEKIEANLFPLIKAGQKALVLGINNGVACSPIAFQGLYITGVDINEYALVHCEDYFAEAGLSNLLTLFHADAIDFMQKNEDKYDLVLMTDFLMFFKKTEGKELIRLAYESLAPGGRVWIETTSTSDDCYGVVSCMRKIDDETFLCHTHCMGAMPFCFYHPMEIEKFFSSMGAEIIFRAEDQNMAGKVVNYVLAQKPA